METAPLPSDHPPPPAGRSTVRRWLPVVLSGLCVLGFAVALTMSFLGGSGDDSADVVRIDPNGTRPPELATTVSDPVGEKIGALTYTTFDGETKDLKPAGRPLLLNFWSSTCTPCVKEMPDLDAVWRANRGKVDVLGLDYIEPPSEGQKMADRTGVTYPLGRDARGSLLRRFGGGTGLPYTVLIGKDGTILAVHPGVLDQAGFQRLIDTAVGR